MVKLPLKEALQLVKIGTYAENKRLEIVDASTGEILANFNFMENDFIIKAISYFSYYVVKIEVNDFSTSLCVESEL